MRKPNATLTSMKQGADRATDVKCPVVVPSTSSHSHSCGAASNGRSPSCAWSFLFPPCTLQTPPRVLTRSRWFRKAALRRPKKLLRPERQLDLQTAVASAIARASVCVCVCAYRGRIKSEREAGARETGSSGGVFVLRRRPHRLLVDHLRS